MYCQLINCCFYVIVEDYDKALTIQRMIQLNQEQDPDSTKEQVEENETDSSKTRSAFRTVQQGRFVLIISFVFWSLIRPTLICSLTG